MRNHNRRAFLKSGALYVPAVMIFAPKLIATPYLPHRRKAFLSSGPSPFLWFKPESLTGAEDDPIATWADSSGNGYDATQGTAGNRPITKTNGFDGLSSAEFVDVSDTLSTASVTHNIGTGDFAILVWVKNAGTGTYQGICGNGTFAPGLYANVTSAQWGAYWGADRLSGGATLTGVWTHVAFVRESGTLKFYKDGTQEATTHSVGTSMSNAAFHIGSPDGSNGMPKELGEVKLFTQALSEAQIDAEIALRSP